MKPYLRQDSSACLKRGMVEIFTLKDVDGEIQLMYTFMQITWAKLFSFQWSIQLSKRLSTAAGTALLLAGAFAPNACKWISAPPPPLQHIHSQIYSCGAKVFDSPSIAVALWCCLWVAVKQFCSSLYISSTSFWNGDDEFFWPHFTYRVPFNEHLSLVWKLFSFITDLQFEPRVSLPHYKFHVILLW